MRLVLLALLVLVGGRGAFAQQDPPRAFEAIRSNESYRKAVSDTYLGYESSLSGHCAKIDMNMNTSQAKVLGRFETDANGNIVNGYWMETTAGVACGEKRLYNAFVVISASKPEVFSLFPGHSYASPVLQRDAVQYASTGVSVGAGCAAEVIDTALPNGEPSVPKTPWVEKWTLRACGKRSLVTVHFIPDATGTTISVTPRETVALP